MFSIQKFFLEEGSSYLKIYWQIIMILQGPYLTREKIDNYILKKHSYISKL